MEDSKKFCDNCKRDISIKNFELHITHCKRNIRFCDLCNEPISTNRFKAHLDEDHAVEPCSNCEIPLEKWMLPQHQESCERRLVSCQFCEAEFYFNEYDEHKKFCGSRTEKCVLCQKYIMLKDRETHSLESCERRYVSCQFCEAEIYFNEYDEHKNFCGSRTEKCVLCQKYIMLKDKEAHSLTHISPKEIHKKKHNISQEVEQNPNSGYNSKFHPSVPNKFSQKSNASQDKQKEAMQYAEITEPSPEKSEAFNKHYGVCHICKCYVAWVDMNVHIPTCATDAGKCSQCGEDVSDRGIKEHMQKYCPKLLERASPKRYDSDAKQTKRSENRQNCYDNHIYEEIPALRHSTDNATSLQSKSKHFADHEKNESRNSTGSPASLPVKSETYCICPLCHISVPRAEIKIHINLCNADSEKCVHCGEDVPTDEMEKHVCFIDKGIYDSVGVESDHIALMESAFEVTAKTCSYCYQSCSTDHILDHVKNCPQNLYECASCGERLPEKDRGKHDGFYCKALIASYPPSNSHVATYAESVKNASGYRDFGPTSWDQDSICPSCHRNVPIHGLEEHSLVCESRIKSCKFCLQDVQVEFETYHLNVCPMVRNQESYMSRDPKDHGFNKKGAVPKNKKRSDSIMKTCQFCKAMQHSDMLKHHLEECQNRYITCECGIEMKLKFFETHAKRNCHKTFSIKERKKGNQKTQKDKPSTVQRIKNWLGVPESRYISSEGISEYYADHGPASYSETCKPAISEFPRHLNLPEPDLIPCEFCNKKFPFDDIVEHTTGCDPELVSKLKRNPSSYERKSESFSFQDSFFETGKAAPTAVTRQPRKKNEERGAEPGEFISHSIKDEEYGKKYLGSKVKSFWGETVDTEESSGQSSDEGKPEHDEDKKDQMREPVPKQLAAESDEELLPYNASINKRNLAHSKVSIQRYNKETENRSDSSRGYPYSSNQRNRGTNMELNSDCEDQEINKGKVSKDFNRLGKSASGKKFSKKVNEDSDDSMQWSDCQSQELKKDAVQEKLHRKTVPVKMSNTKIKDYRDQTDVIHDRKSLKERVNERGSEMQRDKYKSKCKRDEHELPQNAEISVYKAGYTNLSEDDFVAINDSSNSKFGVIGQDRNIQGKLHSEASFIQREKESSLEMESGISKSTRAHEDRDAYLQKQEMKSEMGVNEPLSNNLSKEDYSKYQQYSFRSPTSEELDGNRHKVYSDEDDEKHFLKVKHDEFRSSKIFENTDPDILPTKQDRESEMDKNKSSLSNSVDYHQKLQNFSFKSFEKKELESTKNRLDYKESSTGVTAKEYVDIYSGVKKLSAKYLTVQYGQKDKSIGYVSSLTLGDKTYLSLPELKSTKEEAEEQAAKRAMAEIKGLLEDLSRSCEELESRESDLQRKQDIEPYSDKGVSSQDYQKYQNLSQKYFENEELGKDKDIRVSRASSGEDRFQDMSRSSKTRKSREGDLLSRKHAFKMEMHVTKPFSTSSAEDYEKHQHLSSTAPKDKRLENSRNKVSVNDNEDQDKVFFRTEHDMSRAIEALEKERSEILQQMQGMSKEVSANRQSSILTEAYQKHQYPFSRSSEMKRFEDNQGKGDSRKSSTESGNQDISKSIKSIENRALDMDAQTMLQQKKSTRTEKDAIGSLGKIPSVDEYKMHLSSLALESKEFQDRRNKTDSRELSLEARYQNIENTLKVLPDKLRSYKANENKEPDSDVNWSLSKNSAYDYQKYRSSKVVENEKVEDKKNKIDSTEFLAQGRNRGYENPAFNVEPVTDVQKENIAQDKSYDQIIGGMKDSLQKAKLVLGVSDERSRDIDAMISEHEKRVEAWKKWRDSKKDSEEDL